jgi:hypothetical protein
MPQDTENLVGLQSPVQGSPPAALRILLSQLFLKIRTIRVLVVIFLPLIFLPKSPSKIRFAYGVFRGFGPTGSVLSFLCSLLFGIRVHPYSSVVKALPCRKFV